MIVLDEQLLGRQLDAAIAAWYRGGVRFLTELRPHTVIKDDAIPGLLGRLRQPTFVTINERDFWGRVAISQRFCVVCFSLTDSQTHLIPPLLRRLLRHPAFRTKARRMGAVVRVTGAQASYYTLADRTLRQVVL
jgi:hypothetical protein